MEPAADLGYGHACLLESAISTFLIFVVAGGPDERKR